VGCASSASTVPIVYPAMDNCPAPAIYSAGAPGDVVVSDSLLVLPRVAADTLGQCACSTLTIAHTALVSCAGASVR
jgi:hypothetical protein